MKVLEFYVKESIFNPTLFVLIAKTEDGKEWVVAGDHHHQTYLKPINHSVDVPNQKSENEQDINS